MRPFETRSVAELCTCITAGDSPNYLFFWGHKPKGDTVGPWLLSQWFPSLFQVDGQTYLSAEHWMMAEKARLFGDQTALARILESATPAQAKKLGRTVRGFVPDIWEKHRLEIVVQGSLHKFSSNPEWRSYLLSTQGRVLVEASPPDRIWGIGLGATSARGLGPSKWPGLNLLGFALMEARARLAY